MSDAPERIICKSGVYCDYAQHWLEGEWEEKEPGVAVDPSREVEYIRADLHQKALDRIEELEAKLSKSEALLSQAVEALQKCADPHRYHAPCPHCCQTITECGSYIARAALKGTSDA